MSRDDLRAAFVAALDLSADTDVEALEIGQTLAGQGIQPVDRGRPVGQVEGGLGAEI